jgi:hypothetical protein
MPDSLIVLRGDGNAATGGISFVVRRQIIGGRQQYEIHFENRTYETVEVFFLVGGVPLHSTIVPARSRCRTLLELANSHNRQFSIDVRSDGSHMRIAEKMGALAVPAQADMALALASRVQSTKSKRKHWPILVAVAALLASSGLAAIGCVLAIPRVNELAAPSQALAGSTIDVPYASAGIGNLRYTVTSALGTHLASGSLNRPFGALHVSLPRAYRDQTYRVRVTLEGLLGAAFNEADIYARAMPRPRKAVHVAARPPQIRSFAVTANTEGPPGIDAYYDVDADSGSVEILDTRGIQYGVSPLNRTGRAHFAMPSGIDAATLAVVLRAQRRGLSSETRIALPSLARQPGPIAAPPVKGDDSGAESPIIVPAVVGIEPIQIRIAHHYPNLRLSLFDDKGQVVAETAVPSDTTVVALAHPAVTTATRFTIQARYQVNTESDIIIRHVLIRPPANSN